MIRPLILLLLLTGCFCYKGSVSEFGQLRKDIKPKNFVLDKSVYDKIDTTVVYELIGKIFNDEYHKLDYSRGKSYLRFYPNYKVSYFLGIGYDSESFSNIPEYELTRNDFNPTKSRMGYLYKKEDKLITNISILKHQCNLYILKSEITFNSDTLIQSHIGPPYEKSKNVFIKKRIPKELIEKWEPDW